MGLLAFIGVNALLVVALLGAIRHPASIIDLLREIAKHPLTWAFQIVFLGSCLVAGWGIVSAGYLSWSVRTPWGTWPSWALAGLVAMGCVFVAFASSVYENDFKSRKRYAASKGAPKPAVNPSTPSNASPTGAASGLRLAVLDGVGESIGEIAIREDVGKHGTMDFTICHLYERPQLRDAVASLIHNEFWTKVPGASVEKMAARLGEASTANALPLCLIALQGDELLGAINLVDSDDDDHTDWHPWLAGMVVAAPHRGQGIGSQLVRALLVEAKRLNFDCVYFGTDGPRFYERLGAVVHHVPREGFWFMRFDLSPATTSRSG